MKKQILFYIGWDISFTIFLYAYAKITIMLREYALRTMETMPGLVGSTCLTILAGGIISVLVFKSSKFHFNRKSFFLEFIIVGIPSFYLATLIILPYMMPSVIGYTTMQYSMLFWLIQTSTPMIFGSILFGYELFILVFRIVSCNRSSPNSKKYL